MRTKARIARVGTIEDRNGRVVINGWRMDFADCNDDLRDEPVQRDDDGQITGVGNYTIDELRAIAAEHRVAARVIRPRSFITPETLEKESTMEEEAKVRLSVVAGRAAGHATAVLFVLCIAVATPVCLGLAAGAFWRAFRWVQGW